MTKPTDPRVEAAARALRIEQCLSVQRSHTYASISLKAADKAAWLPIETAPRDGTPVLIYTKNGHTCCAFWGDGDWYEDEWVWLPEEHNTHWQPLPTPPETP